MPLGGAEAEAAARPLAARGGGRVQVVRTLALIDGSARASSSTAFMSGGFAAADRNSATLSGAAVSAMAWSMPRTTGLTLIGNSWASMRPKARASS